MDMGFLREHPLTDALSNEELANIGPHLVPFNRGANAAICIEGHGSPGLVLVREGRVRISKRAASAGELTLAELEAPTVIGEMELVTGDACAATAVSETALVAHLLAYDTFHAMLEAGDASCSKMLRNITRVVVKRLAIANEHMVAQARPEQVQEFDQFKRKLIANWSF